MKSMQAFVKQVKFCSALDRSLDAIGSLILPSFSLQVDGFIVDITVNKILKHNFCKKKIASLIDEFTYRYKHVIKLNIKKSANSIYLLVF